MRGFYAWGFSEFASRAGEVSTESQLERLPMEPGVVHFVGAAPFVFKGAGFTGDGSK